VLYVYAGGTGIYEPRGAAFVERLLERHAGDYVTNQVRNEIVGKIERMSKTEQDLEANPERLVVGNGILDLHTGELEPFSPHEYHTTSIDVDWNPDAGEPEAIDEFLHDIVEPGDVPTLYRLIAHTLYKEYLGEKAAILIGSGSNGKSVFLSLVEEFVGSYNVAHRELQDFDEDGFAANNLQGKLANLATEIGEEEIQNATTFKKLTGRDSIQAQVKFEKPVKFENFASLMFATNEMPVFGQDNHAIWRRWLYIDFPYTFDDDDPTAKDPVPERVLKDRLFRDEELEALLVRCQKEIQRWHQGRPFYDDAMDAEAVRDKMKKAAEPVYAFGSSCLTSVDVDEDGYVEKSVVRAAYKAYASEEDLPRISENEFGKRLMALRDYNLESTRKRVNGQRKRVYEGIKLSDRGRQVLGVDEPDDDQQTVDDNRPAAKPTVMEQARNLVEDNDNQAIPREGLVWACAGKIGKATAENSVDRLLKEGKLYENGNGELLPT
jgi:putative DNA primase/helicase